MWVSYQVVLVCMDRKFMGLLNLQQNRSILLRVLVVLTALELVSLVSPVGVAAGDEWFYSDANHDSVVDSSDLLILASNWLDSDCNMYPAWCNYSDLDRDGEVNMVDFVKIVRNWNRRTYTLKNTPDSPTRLAYGPDESLYVTDPKLGSVFIYDPNMILVSELKKLNKPLGIAVSDSGDLYVGSDGNDCVEVYDPNGFMVKKIGAGVIKMPNDLAFDDDGNLYVVDSLSDTIRVYDTNGVQIRTIDDGDLRFPSAIEIAYKGDGTGELYVGDQGHQRIKVFDLNGTFLRSFGSSAYKSMMGSLKWQGRFVNVQSLTMDEFGQLHVLDSSMKKVQILNPETAAGVHTNVAIYIGSYGEEGAGPGQMKLGQDIAISQDNKVIVTDTFNKRIEIIYTIPIP